MSDGDGKIYLPEMAAELSRAEHTLRSWLRDKERAPQDPDQLPDDLVPHREGGRQRIYWTPDQLHGMREYAAERERRRGWQPQT